MKARTWIAIRFMIKKKEVEIVVQILENTLTIINFFKLSMIVKVNIQKKYYYRYYKAKYAY